MSVSKSFNHFSGLVSMKEVEEKAPMKQGIVTILGSDCERSRAGSIRRTLSADMSSKKWLAQNGFFSPVKKIGSSQELVVNSDGDSSSSEECEKNLGQDDVWRSIQSQKEMQKPSKLDVWGTILTQKSENPASNLLPPPYVHPLVRRSASSLSEKSLEICTESLGSETGSDGFSSYPTSEILSDIGDEDKEEMQMVALKDDIKVANPFEDLHVVKYKSSPVRPLPPPLPSISGGDGASLHMHSHRKNGRLVLEAIAVPPTKNFRAQRVNGRLILTLINRRLDSQEKKVEEFEEVFDNMEEVDASIEEEMVGGGGDDDNEEEVMVVEKEKFDLNNGGKENDFFMEQNSKSLPIVMMNVHKSPPMMKKLMGLDKKNPTLSHKFNKAVNSMEAEEVVAEKEAIKELPIPQSLPPRPPARLIPSPAPPQHPVVTAFNAYEYFWRSKTSVTGGQINPMIPTQQPTLFKPNMFNGAKAYNHQEMAPTPLKGNKTGHFVPYLRGCNKKPRSPSPLISEPYCIATS